MTQQIIRILFMPSESFPTDRVRINVLFGRELLARGHQIDLVMQAADESVQTGVRAWFGRELHVGPTDSGDGRLHRMHKLWLGVRHDLRSLREARRADYDGILVSDKFLVAAIIPLLLLRRKMKLLFWLTFPIPEVRLQTARDGSARYPILTWMRGVLEGWLLYKWILPRSDHVFVQSERMKRDICARSIDRAKVSPILTGFSPADILPVDRRHSAATTDVVTLAYLGTLDALRHLEILVDMLASLHQEGMKAKLLLVGRGDRPRDEARLTNHAASRGVAAYMEITGFLPQPQALERVASADVCLSPIYRSPILDVGSPTKLIEYLALGLPVVANDHPEQKDILRASRAGVCVPWGAQHFARGVRWLMRRSPAEREAMGLRGRAWVEANRTYARIAVDVERTCLAVLGSDCQRAHREVVASGQKLER
jgi:glycosyltransferase involved in cell wall biosynthesis